MVSGAVAHTGTGCPVGRPQGTSSPGRPPAGVSRSRCPQTSPHWRESRSRLSHALGSRHRAGVRSPPRHRAAEAGGRFRLQERSGDGEGPSLPPNPSRSRDRPGRSRGRRRSRRMVSGSHSTARRTSRNFQSRPHDSASSRVSETIENTPPDGIRAVGLDPYSQAIRRHGDCNTTGSPLRSAPGAATPPGRLGTRGGSGMGRLRTLSRIVAPALGVVLAFSPVSAASAGQRGVAHDDHATSPPALLQRPEHSTASPRCVVEPGPWVTRAMVRTPRP